MKKPVNVCGKGMPSTGETCAHFSGHNGRCRSARGVEAYKQAKAAHSKAIAASRGRFLDAYKLTVGCTDCGYVIDPVALDFDHDDPGLKAKNIAAMHKDSWENLLTELSKCTVRCANCHRIKTHRNKLRTQVREQRTTMPPVRGHATTRGSSVGHESHPLVEGVRPAGLPGVRGPVDGHRSVGDSRGRQGRSIG